MIDNTILEINKPLMNMKYEELLLKNRVQGLIVWLMLGLVSIFHIWAGCLSIDQVLAVFDLGSDNNECC